MSENKRFNIIDDEWIGLIGAEFVTAIEDSDNPKKTVYFVHNHNVKGIADLLNEQHERIQVLENENEELKSHLQMWELIYDD